MATDEAIQVAQLTVAVKKVRALIPFGHHGQHEECRDCEIANALGVSEDEWREQLASS